MQDVTAFVTGASQGIGREIAITLGERGANVALAARSDGIHETAEIIDDPDRTLAVETDVAEEESIESSIQESVEEFGGLDVLVNNAGIAGPVEPFTRIDAEDWDYLMKVNLRGPWLCAKHSAPHLRNSDRGRIINISSIGGKRPYPNRSPYAASKMGLIGLTRTLAYELGHSGVTVNAVCPGAVRGDRIERAIEAQAELQDEEGVRTFSASPSDFALQEMFVEKRDVAEQVAYLASEAADHVTAQDVNVDSGATWY